MEQIDQQRIQIHQIVFVILRGKTHDVGKRVLGEIENRVQQPLIHRNVPMSGGFQQLIGRNAFVASRLQNQIGMWQIRSQYKLPQELLFLFDDV